MPLPKVIPQLPGPQLTTIIKAEAADLETYLAGIPPDAWERPSGAPGWSIAEVVAHLAMGADLYYTYISRALTGEVSPSLPWWPTSLTTCATPSVPIAG